MSCLSISRGWLVKAAALGFILSNIGLPRIAIAAPELPSPAGSEQTEPTAEAQPHEEAQTEATATKTQPESVQFKGDGNPYFFESAELTMVPPQDWDVETHVGGVTAIMEAPKVEIPGENGEKTVYRRNITVAVIHKPSPIDEWRAKEIRGQMLEKYSKDGLVKDFQILEHKFFDFRGKNDGLLLYSSLLIDETPLMQMHLLVSGSERQYLMTFTDLAESFTDQTNGRFEQAWNTMTTITINGVAPTRLEQWSKYGIIAGCCLLVIMIIGFFRFRARRRNYQDEADELYSDSVSGDDDSSIMATLAFGWRLDRKYTGNGDEDFADDDFYADDVSAPRSSARSLPQTKVASELSNF